jgi:hypothetical protein
VPDDERGGTGGEPNDSIMSVTTRPGATALIRTPFSAASIAAERVSEITAAFDAE